MLGSFPIRNRVNRVGTRAAAGGGLPFHEFLATQGEGLHHLVFNTEDFDSLVRQFEAAGSQSPLLAEAYVPTYQGTVRVCHFDTRAVGGVIFEVLWKSWLQKG